MILTIDIGNSRIKWATWQASVIVERGVAAYIKSIPSQCFDELFSVLGDSSKDSIARVFVASVADDAISTALQHWVKQRWDLDAEFLKTQKQYKNICHAYVRPEQHGVDRWAGVVAGHQRFPESSVCIISAGTAMTFDFVDKGGRHLGGYILPSYASMHAALQADTAKIESVLDVRFINDDIPNNTNDAVNQGLHKFILAGVREMCLLGQAKMDVPMKIIITGGFAEVLLAYPGMPVMFHEPDLVMQGLYNIMSSQKSES